MFSGGPRGPNIAESDLLVPQGEPSIGAPQRICMGSSTQMTRSQFHSGSSPSQWFFYSILLDGVNISALSLEDFYMREFWVQIGTSPIVYRYIDWSITVPLQMVEFYLILSACSAVRH